MPHQFLQGSVLSPTLFLLLMDPLLTSLFGRGLGPSTGAFAHADDVCMVRSSLVTIQQQINTMQTFATENALTLNPSKCEVLLISSSKPTSHEQLLVPLVTKLLPQEITSNASVTGGLGIFQLQRL